MPAVIYRAGKLGVELSEALNDMVDAQAVPSEMHEQVMQSFDKHISELLKDNWTQGQTNNNTLQGRIEDGVIKSYRNVNNTWEFFLESATFRGQAFSAAQRTSKDPGKKVRDIHVVIIDQKTAEAERPVSPPRAKAIAAAADADSAPAMTADTWDEYEDEPPQQPSQPAGHVNVEQAQAQRLARAEEQKQAAAREQYEAASQTSLALACGAGPSSQPSAAAADEDEDVDDWETVEKNNPLDDKPANKKQKRAGEDAKDDFDFGEELNSDDDGTRMPCACLDPPPPPPPPPPPSCTRAPRCRRLTSLISHARALRVWQTTKTSAWPQSRWLPSTRRGSRRQTLYMRSSKRSSGRRPSKSGTVSFSRVPPRSTASTTRSPSARLSLRTGSRTRALRGARAQRVAARCLLVFCRRGTSRVGPRRLSRHGTLGLGLVCRRLLDGSAPARGD